MLITTDFRLLSILMFYTLRIITKHLVWLADNVGTIILPGLYASAYILHKNGLSYGSEVQNQGPELCISPLKG